ncbi:cytochrome P450 monooxygenase-like protein [Penicillium herquei]|nr:cytochrome P450 monooxygenase-like protein [Penicillium herquei]
MGDPTESLHTVRIRDKHDARRRLWARFLSSKALREFEQREIAYVNLMIEQIRHRAGQSLNVTRWMNFFTFDVTAEFALGLSFGMLANGEPHPIMETMHSGQRYFAALSPVPWLGRILLKLPAQISGASWFKAWCAQQVQRQREITHGRQDFMSILLEEAEKQNQTMEARRWLSGDCRLVIVAGSDTTAAALVRVRYYLARFPQKAQRIRDALTHASVSPVSQLRQRDIQDIEFLNAFINETLRLHPPVPSALLRVTPPEGLVCGKTYIPGGVTVSVPMRQLGRLASIYARPNEFIPERWLSSSHLMRKTQAFTSFSTGPYTCIGKNLAMTELQTMTAALVQHFWISFAPGEAGNELLKGSIDAFTLCTGNLKIVFDPIAPE